MKLQSRLCYSFLFFFVKSRCVVLTVGFTRSTNASEKNSGKVTTK